MPKATIKGKTKDEVNIDIELIINQNLYKKKFIDEETYSFVNEELRKRLKILQVS